MTGYDLPYDRLPADVRRASWGWFGPPWPSDVCYGEDGRLREDMRKPTPFGEDCVLCTEPIEPGQSGRAVPHLGDDGKATIRHAHKECVLREVIGPPEHLDGRCTCRDPGRPARSYRAEALELWERVGRGWDAPAATERTTDA